MKDFWNHKSCRETELLPSSQALLEIFLSFRAVIEETKAPLFQDLLDLIAPAETTGEKPWQHVLMVESVSSLGRPFALAQTFCQGM